MTVAAIDRCLSLIETLAGEAAPLDLGEIAERIGMPKSATHRLLATLKARSWVVQDPVGQGYALSLHLSTLAFRNLDARQVPDLAQSVLDALAERTGEYCRLAIVEGEGLAWVARAQGARSGLRYDPDMGQEVVLHATATGKAWLATLPENDALRIVCARGFVADRPLGPRSMTTVDALRRHLAETRKRGYAMALEEGEPGTVAFAVPFRAAPRPGAPVVGTISVAGPLARIGPERYQAIGAALGSAAAEVEALWPLRARQRGARPGRQQEQQRAGEPATATS